MTPYGDYLLRLLTAIPYSWCCAAAYLVVWLPPRSPLQNLHLCNYAGYLFQLGPILKFMSFYAVASWLSFELLADFGA